MVYKYLRRSFLRYWRTFKIKKRKISFQEETKFGAPILCCIQKLISPLQMLHLSSHMLNFDIKSKEILLIVLLKLPKLKLFKIIIFSLLLVALVMIVLEYFFVKHSPRILGVNTANHHHQVQYLYLVDGPKPLPYTLEFPDWLGNVLIQCYKIIDVVQWIWSSMKIMIQCIWSLVWVLKECFTETL